MRGGQLDAGRVSGYRITPNIVIEKLKGNKKYFVRIRAFKKVRGKTYYSDWSKVKNVKVKK